MNKSFVTVSVLALLLFGGCSKSSTDEPLDKELTELTAYLSFESRASASSNEGTLCFLWNSGDKMRLYDSGLLTRSAIFTLKEGAGKDCGIFKGEFPISGQPIYCVSPSERCSIEDGNPMVDIPTIQNASSSVNSTDAVLLGVSTNFKDVVMHPATSSMNLKVRLGEKERISSVRCYTAKTPLAGKCKVDFSSLAIYDATSLEVSAKFSQAAVGSAETLLSISPVDFSKEKLYVRFDVESDSGKYIFAYNPGSRFEAGCAYPVVLDISSFREVFSEEELSQGTFFRSEASDISLREVRVTDSTAAVEWSNCSFATDYSSNLGFEYRLSLYNADGSLAVKWRPNAKQCITKNELFSYTPSNPTFPPRFIFTGLEPDKDYSVIVENLSTNKVSSKLNIHTLKCSSEKATSVAINQGDVVLYENFSSLIWNGDTSTYSAGYVSSNFATLTNIFQGAASSDQTSSSIDFFYTRRDYEDELFVSYSKLLGSMGLSDWGWWINPNDASSSNSTVYARPGYVKVSSASSRGGIVTPKLTSLTNCATVKVRFKAFLFEKSYKQGDNPEIEVAAIDGVKLDSSCRVISSNTISSKKLSLESSLEWKDYEVVLTNVTADSRIIIRSSAATSSFNRFLLDDVNVILEKYEQSESKVPKLSVIFTEPHAATLAWTEQQQDQRTYTISLYRDESCKNLLKKLDLTITSTETYVKWPARFTFSLLEENTTYYAQVTNLSGISSNVVSFTTQAKRSVPSNAIIYQPFDNLPFGGNYMESAMAFSLSDVTISEYSPESLSDAWNHLKSVNATEDGSAVTTYSDSMIALMGLSGWSTSKAYIHPGYLKVGTSSVGGYVTTPMLSTLGKDNSKIILSFRAGSYMGNNNDPQADHLVVNLIDENGKVKATKDAPFNQHPSAPTWENYTMEFSGADYTDRIQFKTSGASNTRFCVDDILVTSDDVIKGDKTFGYVKDTTGKPLEGIAISDGFTVTKTDSKGYYELDTTMDTWYIFYSIPSEADIEVNENGSPLFFERFYLDRKRYDFKIKMRAGGPQQKFNLICMADPQARSGTMANRFRDETVPAIKQTASTYNVESYGVTLGDVVYSSGSNNANGNMENMRSLMARDRIGIPIFQTMGNHDYTYFYGSSNPLRPDATSSSINLKAQRAFETCYGPVNYSWNRAKTHIVCMKDVIYNSTTDASDYTGGFLLEQYKWFQQDLAQVPKDYQIILCVHIPFASSSANGKYMRDMITLMKKYASYHIMSGHTHYMRNETNLQSLGIYEHVHAAICGCWWNSNMNGDGCPNGYGVYEIEGNQIANSYYQGTNKGQRDKYQIRLYRGDALLGGAKQWFKWQHGSSVLLANIFNASDKWIIKVYEDGQYTGNMAKIAYKKYTDSSLPKSNPNSHTTPTMIPSNSSQDWWAIGYHVGVLGKTSSYYTAGYHMFKYTLKNPSASIKVVATDEYGTEYTATQIEADVSGGYPAYIKTGYK
ncbi:MAG: calcineurin-like phosphoesterase C-terminal domain-containing protein [Alistipes sp.]|nr:calcineurin-like phosphoesterase C-terminal domain-containing protein [Candidatus Alistipes equi]